jgi:hypothetical protein
LVFLTELELGFLNLRIKEAAGNSLYSRIFPSENELLLISATRERKPSQVFLVKKAAFYF